MKDRRLSLNREVLTTLDSDQLSSVSGAVSTPHPLCALTSIGFSWCNTCGIACTFDCPTPQCGTDKC